MDAKEKQKSDLQNTQSAGAMEDMHRLAATMFHLGSMLMTKDKKIRVTIECDPEAGRYEITREILPINP